MKKLKQQLLVILFILLGHMLNAQVLATSGSYQYTQSEFNKSVKFTEFICGVTLNSKELASLKNEEISDFKLDPVTALNNVQSLDDQMQQVYALTDPFQIGISRSMLIANLYFTVQEMPDDYAFKVIFNTHNVVLAIDPYNGIALTQKDVNSYFDYLTFYAGIMGQTIIYDQATRNAYTQSVIDQFLYGDNQTKGMLAIMTIYNEYMQAAYNQLSFQEKQQFAASMTNNYTSYEQNYDYSSQNYSNNNNSSNDYQTQQMYYDVMNDMMNQSHATSLNIIENIGGTGNYWEVVDY
ncbi:MAG: hypothetical protein JXL97_12290 [Bacteroidales bacterium]|nr:hypothetical protein [Bacteroidales bacterium]